MVMVFDNHEAVTPLGRSIGVPMPVAPVVTMVMLLKAELIHKVGADDGVAAVFTGVTVIVPVALIFPQPPVNGTL